MTDIRYLTAENTVFRKTTGGMLSAEVEGEHYPAVFLHCSFPHTDKNIYISVRTGKHKEVGMIRSIDDFPDETADLLQTQMKIRYFAPNILQVNKIKEEFGYAYWETETDAGSCRFTVRSGGSNVKMVTEKKVLITDVDGNRFVIEDIECMSEKEYRMIEMCM